MEFLLESTSKIFVFYLPFLFSLCFHELSHAYVAFKKGDDTAYLLGRMNLNPLSHMDFIGTLVLPLMGLLSGWGFIFGWAKPVPVNTRNLKNPLKDMFWIALAGPLSNFILAVIGSFIFTLCVFYLSDVYLKNISQLLNTFIFLNLLLCFFNLIPLHPLDGGKILEPFLPYEANVFLKKHQMTLNMLLIGFFIIGGFKYFVGPMIFLHQFLNGFFYLILSPLA